MSTTEQTAELTVENYELTVGEGDLGVALTFDVDDLPEKGRGLHHVQSLDLAPDAFLVAISASESLESQPLRLRFPFQQGMDEIVEAIKTHYGRLYVAALGEGQEPGTSAILFERDMVLV